MNKGLLIFIVVLGIIPNIFAKFVYIPSSEPNTPGNWVWEYIDFDGKYRHVKNPVAVPQWEYHVFEESRGVVLFVRSTAYAQKIKDLPNGSVKWISPPVKATFYTHEEFLKDQLFDHWLDPNHISGGYDLTDFANLARKYAAPKRIINPVVHLKTSKVYHLSTCTYVKDVQPDLLVIENEKDAQAHGLRPCKICKPYIVESEVPLSTTIDPNDIPEEIRPIIESLLNMENNK